MKQLLILILLLALATTAYSQALPTGSPTSSSTGWKRDKYVQATDGIILPIRTNLNITYRYPTLILLQRVGVDTTMWYWNGNRFLQVASGAITGGGGGGGGTPAPVNWTLGYPTYDLRYSNIAHSHTFAAITNKPTTVGGYGITDAFTQAQGDLRYALNSHAHTFASLTQKPTTILGYGITDALSIPVGDARYSLANHIHNFSAIANKPTTMQGYGITDGLALSTADTRYALLAHAHTFASLTNKPNTIEGYGITNAFTQAQASTLFAPITHSHANYIPITAAITINGVTKNLNTNPSFTVSGGTGTGGGVSEQVVNYKIDSLAKAGILGFAVETPFGVAAGAGPALDTLAMRPESITAAHIDTGAVGSTEIANGSVNADKLASASVGSDELQDGSVIAGKLGSNAITNGNLAPDVRVGSLAALTTADKSSVVGAINELKSQQGSGSGGGGSGVGFTDATVTTTNATPSNIATISTASGETGVLEVTMTGSTNANTAITGKKIVRYKNVAGTVTLGTISNTLPDEVDGGLAGASWTVSSSSTNLIIPVTGVAATTINWATKYVQTKVSSVSGGGGSASYQVERTWQLNFGNQYSNSSAGWNNIAGAGVENIVTANAYTKSGLVTTTGTTTSLAITNTTAWLDVSGGVGSPQTPNTGVFSDMELSTAWIFPSTAQVKLTGLNPNKYYQFYILANMNAYIQSVVNFTIGATTTSNVNTAANFGDNTGPQLDDAALAKIFNARPNAQGEITITCTVVSSTNSLPTQGPLNAIVIEESNIAK